MIEFYITTPGRVAVYREIPDMGVEIPEAAKREGNPNRQNERVIVRVR